MNITVLWVVMPCSLVESYQHLEELVASIFKVVPKKWRQQISLKFLITFYLIAAYRKLKGILFKWHPLT
jgi:hypothetical protein